MIHRIIMLLLVFDFLVMSLVCEAGPSGGWGGASRRVYMAYKYAENPDALSFVLWGVVMLLVLGVVAITLQGLCKLIQFTFRGLWKLIQFTVLGLVVYLPCALWEEKLFIPLLWRNKLYIPKLPWLLQVKKFRRPDIWASNIPWGLFIINLLLWACDVFLGMFCLYDRRFLYLLVPTLILTYYLYVGVYWSRIVIIVLLVLACPACVMYFGEEGLLIAYACIGLIVLLWLPKSNAWFRKQNVDDARERLEQR